MVNVDEIIESLKSNTISELEIPQRGYCNSSDYQHISKALHENISVKKVIIDVNSVVDNGRSNDGKYDDKIYSIWEIIGTHKTIENVVCKYSFVKVSRNDQHQKNAYASNIDFFAKFLRSSNHFFVLSLELDSEHPNMVDTRILAEAISNPTLKHLGLSLKKQSLNAGSTLLSLRNNRSLTTLSLEYSTNPQWGTLLQQQSLENIVIEGLAYGLSENSSLTELSYSGDINASLAKALQNNSMLESFNHLHGSVKDEDALVALNQVIRVNKVLKVLNLLGDYEVPELFGGSYPIKAIQRSPGEIPSVNKTKIDIQDKRILGLTDSIQSNSTLTSLALNLSVTNVGVKALCEALQGKYIKTKLILFIINGQISQHGYTNNSLFAVANGLVKNTSVTEITLMGSRVNCSELGSIFKTNKTLKKLDLRLCEIKESSQLLPLTQALEKNESLEECLLPRLGNPHQGKEAGEALIAVAHTIQHNIALNRLHISGYFSVKSVIYFIKTLAINRTLKELKFDASLQYTGAYDCAKDKSHIEHLFTEMMEANSSLIILSFKVQGRDLVSSAINAQLERNRKLQIVELDDSMPTTGPTDNVKNLVSVSTMDNIQKLDPAPLLFHTKSQSFPAPDIVEPHPPDDDPPNALPPPYSSLNRC